MPDYKIVLERTVVQRRELYVEKAPDRESAVELAIEFSGSELWEDFEVLRIKALDAEVLS
jgi:hypothetical protein